jgi:hypothetical protein
MKTYQNFTFEDRAAQAADAKKRTLAQLRAKKPVDPEVQKERLAMSEKRAAAQEEKRASRKAANEAAEQAARDGKMAIEEAEAAQAAAIKPEPTDEERKAARDAKYAARKNRR